MSKNNARHRIGVVVAIELDAVLAKYGTPSETVRRHGYTVHTYINDDFFLFVIDAGAGEISAAAATQVLISEYDVELVLNFGVAGALTEEIKTAELCIIERAIHYDFDTTDWLDLPRGQYPGHDSPYLAADAALLARALEIKPDLKKVTCASADKFISLPKAKAALHTDYQADICEMEAAGILLTCRRCGVPCLLLKAVSDSLLGGGGEFLQELNRVSGICFDVLDQIVRGIRL